MLIEILSLFSCQCHTLKHGGLYCTGEEGKEPRATCCFQKRSFVREANGRGSPPASAPAPRRTGRRGQQGAPLEEPGCWRPLADIPGIAAAPGERLLPGGCPRSGEGRQGKEPSNRRGAALSAQLPGFSGCWEAASRTKRLQGDQSLPETPARPVLSIPQLPANGWFPLFILSCVKICPLSNSLARQQGVFWLRAELVLFI